jgi:lauroyl/myristoyl acyltransferase
VRRGGVAALVADVHRPGMRSHRVRFLDAWADLPAGPAALCRLTGAPAVPFAVVKVGERTWRAQLGEPIAAPPRGSGAAGERALAQALADAFGAVIREHLEQWDAVDPIPWHASDESRAGP